MTRKFGLFCYIKSGYNKKISEVVIREQRFKTMCGWRMNYVSTVFKGGLGS